MAVTGEGASPPETQGDRPSPLAQTLAALEASLKRSIVMAEQKRQGSNPWQVANVLTDTILSNMGSLGFSGEELFSNSNMPAPTGEPTIVTNARGETNWRVPQHRYPKQSPPTLALGGAVYLGIKSAASQSRSREQRVPWTISTNGSFNPSEHLILSNPRDLPKHLPVDRTYIIADTESAVAAVLLARQLGLDNERQMRVQMVSYGNAPQATRAMLDSLPIAENDPANVDVNLAQYRIILLNSSLSSGTANAVWSAAMEWYNQVSLSGATVPGKLPDLRGIDSIFIRKGDLTPSEE